MGTAIWDLEVRGMDKAVSVGWYRHQREGKRRSRRANLGLYLCDMATVDGSVVYFGRTPVVVQL